MSACAHSSGVVPVPVAASADDPNRSSPVDNVAVVIRPAVVRPGEPYAELRLIRRRATSDVAPAGAWDGDTADACPNWQTMPCLVQTIASNSYEAAINCNGNTNCPKTSYAAYLIPQPGFTATFTPDSFVPPALSTVNVTATTAVKPGNVSFAYGFTIVSGAGPGVANTSALPALALCSLLSNKCPSSGILDELAAGTPDVSGSPPPLQKAVIGQEMNFKAAWKSGTGTGSYTVSTSNLPYWHIPDVAVASFDLTTGRAPVPADPTSPQPDFYWTTSSSGTTGDPLSVDVALVRSDGQETAFVHANASYLVQRPTVTYGPTLPQNPPVLTPSVNPDAISQADTTKGYGITFAFAAKAPPGSGGHIGGTQTVWRQITWIPDSVAYDHGTGGLTKLDTCTFYSAVSSVAANATVSWPLSTPFGDRPNVTIGTASVSPLTDVRIQDYFNMYLMYRPTITTSRKAIWVPLGNIAWQWASRAYRSSTVNPWSIGGIPGGSASYTFVTFDGDSPQFPLFSGLYAPQAQTCPPVPAT
jgi:hypothetical protein